MNDAETSRPAGLCQVCRKFCGYPVYLCLGGGGGRCRPDCARYCLRPLRVVKDCPQFQKVN